jgi:YidC/Oxa1 family membrane protein insertase
MEKRTLLAVAICFGILVAWWKLFPPEQPAPPPKPAATAPAQPAGTPGSAPAPGSVPAAGTDTGTPPAAGGTQPAARGPEQRVELESQGARFVLSTWGGTLRQVYLKEERFLHDKHNPASGLGIIGTKTPETAPLRTSFPKASFASPMDGPWAVTRPAPDQVVFRAENEQVVVEKRYRVVDRFQLALEVVVENRLSIAAEETLALHLYSVQDPEKMGSGFWDVSSANPATLVCSLNEDDIERVTVESAFKEPKEYNGVVRWAAGDDKYFAVAAVPNPEAAPSGTNRKCFQRGNDHLNGEVILSFAPRTIAAGGKTSYALTVFAGPKYIEELNKVQPGGQNLGLDKVVDVTFKVLSRPLLALLKIFHSWVGNWGLAIIMLTLFVKLLTVYPTHRAMMSGKKMQRLAPKMQALRKKFENDKQRMGAETMNLYKQEGVSPFGGCLPTLITMPIWIALFSTLNYAVEIHRAPFVGYIQDLSVRDPYFITPLLMGGIMYLQMRMSPAGTDPQQQKMMAIMMPVMFTGFSLFLPAGLALYTLTNSLLAILHQLVINRIDKHQIAAAENMTTAAEKKAQKRAQRESEKKAQKESKDKSGKE